MASEDVVIVPYRDGPYLVRGPLILRDQDGQRIESSRRTVALCRCGKSRMRPFCDGTHRVVQFRAPSEPERPWNEAARPRNEAARPRNEAAVPASEPAGNGHAAAPRDSGAPAARDGGVPAARDGGAPAALAGLRRARRRVAALLEAPCTTRGHAAVRAALPLLDGADRLLEAGVQSSLAALHLVKGASDALGEAAEEREPGVAAAAAELAAVAVALEPQNGGSWRF